MNLNESLRVALESIWANRMRSFLTMLGIVIGVAAVIAVVAIAQGGRSMILGEMQMLGSNLLWVYPKSLEENLNWERIEWLEAKNVRDIQAQVSEVLNLTPENSRQLTLRAGANSRSSAVIGVSHSYANVRNLEVAEGRFFTREEVDGFRRVAVVASNVPEKLLGSEGVVGKAIYLDGIKYTIVGVLEESGGGMFADQRVNDHVYVPYTSLNRLLGERRIDVLYVQAETPEAVERVREDLEEYLTVEFGKDRFSVQSLNELMDVMKNVTGIMTNVVAGIAAVALLVGGIGIMNIMLVSVTERTREIGIRKALGARRKDLLYQFLVEAVVLSGVGGIAGILVGGLMVTIVAKLTNLPSLISVQSVGLAFLFAASVGVLFGVYPASKAGRLDPIEALRYE